MRLALILSILLVAAAASPVARTANDLHIYAVDVEGGKATLIVSPAGESLLIDTGNVGEGAQRDANRIMAAIQDAGLRQIDHLVTTHWHRDHFGAMPLLAARIPIREFIDHGANIQPEPIVDDFLNQTYPRLYGKARHTIVKPGDKIRLAGLDVRVVTSSGESIRTPLPGAGIANPYCAEFEPRSDPTENSRSIGIYIAFGRFRVLDLGDLTINKEFGLMCPNNPIGNVDLFMVSHHGQSSSNDKLLVHAIRSRVAIMNNGIHKGAHPEVMRLLFSAPGLENLWQLHSSQLSGPEYTMPGLFVANMADEPPARIHNAMAYWIKVSAQQDGSFTVVNSRNGFSKTYAARRSDSLIPYSPARL
jgi:beta-lactamase superfamily II metal-dependent hydrolase